MALTNTQYDEIMRGYDRRQTNRQHEIQRRKTELYRKYPDLSALQERINHEHVNLARAMLDHRDSDADHLRNNIKKMLQQKEALFKQYSIPADYLEPPFECNDCRDTGYIGQEPCHCFKQAAIDLVCRQSELKDILTTESFENFSLAYYPEERIDPLTGISARIEAIRAKERCLSFTEKFSEEKANLLIFGDTGLGKTFLSHCIAGALLKQGFSVVYYSAARLFEALCDYQFRREEAKDLDIQSVRSCDLLIIDDLGTEHPNALTVSLFFDCLNDRLLNGRSTIISTNLSLAEIREIYSERISSRIFEHFEQIRLFGDDIRIQKRSGNVAVSRSD